MSKKWVYLFTEVEQAKPTWADPGIGVRGLLGGKGSGLADMTRAGVPVLRVSPSPPKPAMPTCRRQQIPAGMWDQMLAALKQVEEQTGKKFGDPTNPLLVSCRSGAKFSMPGMMDTVLNIGLNDETAEGMVKLTGNRALCL